LRQANVRRAKAGVSIEELADDIARRMLLQSLSVRPVLDAEGNEIGMFEIPAGGRRYRAHELLVKQKRMNKTQPVPCIVRTGGLPEEDSLAENVQSEALHPLDQFRGFQTPHKKRSEEDVDGLKPLSEHLITELTAHRTLALRDALANDPGIALTAVLHALC